MEGACFIKPQRVNREKTAEVPLGVPFLVINQPKSLVRAGDDRASELKAVLEELVEARSAGVWAVGDRVATQLLPWVLRTGEE